MQPATTHYISTTLQQAFLFLFFTIQIHAQQCTTPTTCTPSYSTSRVNASPFLIPDVSLIGRYDVSIPIAFSKHQYCCSTNYTAAWDLQGELLAFSIDNLLCPNFVSAVQNDALHGSMGNWDTYEDLLFRKTLYANESENGQDLLRIQSKYTGFFPGQTKLGVSERVQMTVRKCLEPVVEILLAAPMFRKVKEDRIPRRLRDVPVHFNDVNDVNDNNVNNVDGTDNVNNSGNSDNRGINRGINSGFNSDNLDNLDNLDNKEDNYNSNINSSNTNRIIQSNPMIPMIGSNFYASAALLPEDMHVEHQWPHPDSFVPGLASVYTITKDPKYDTTGTAVVYQPVSNISIVNSMFGGGSISTSNQHFRETSLRLTKHAPLNGVGWLNTTTNTYANAIVVALNKHNRITLYPWNRLHFAYIPSRNLLSSNPKKGRLTLNAFWDIHGETRDSTSKSNFCQDLNRYYGASTERIGIRTKCQKCVAWRGCGWCVGEESCHARSELKPYFFG